MIYFCADDYGISAESNSRIEECVQNGVLNKISVLPNGRTIDFKHLLTEVNAEVSLHINLVEGFPLSATEDVDMLLAKDNSFKYSFVGLLALSLSPKRKEFEKQIYEELKNQIRFWKNHIGEEALLIDSHQHTHMIPLVFKTLLKVIKDENVDVRYLRISSEPVMPYLCAPSLYFTYSPFNIIKQWLLKFLALVNAKQLNESKIKSAYTMGIMFSGKMDNNRVKKLLGKYTKLAEKNMRDIELIFHPGFVKKGDKMMKGIRGDFEKFYLSPCRKVEFDTLIDFEF